MKPLLIGLTTLTLAGSTAMKPGIVEMSTPRATHSATLLHDGRVLVVGGMRANGRYLATAELFDPRAMRFIATAAMPTPRGGHSATLLPDGRVLLAGGHDGGPRALRTALLWDPATGRFSPAGASGMMRTARGDAAAALLPDGRVLLTGGEDAGVATASTEIFDPRTGRFEPGPDMAEPRASHTATLLDAHRLLVSGGGSDASHASRGSEVLDLRTMRFHPVGAMSRARRLHAATRLADGSVLVTGGADARDGAGTWRDAERYDPRTASWSPAGTMVEPRSTHADATAILADGSVLLFGGGMGAEQWSPGSGRFAAVPIMARWPARYHATTTALPDGRVLFLGGHDERGQSADEGIVWAGETR